MDFEQNGSIPDDIAVAANAEIAKLLPEKSRQVYEKEYENFVKWKEAKMFRGITNEEVVIAYFGEKSTKTKSSSLWSYYSMLKKTLMVHEKVDISRYNSLISILKNKSKGHKSKKSRVFQTEDVFRFWREAPDDYLFEKVVSVMGIFGACRTCELYNLTTKDVEDRGHVIMVNLRDTKTDVDRCFGIIGDENGINPVDIVKKYSSLRSQRTEHNFFFVNYRDRKCTVQRIGINKMYKVPERIAKYLKLDSPTEYTGHCFRRSSATILANNGGDLINVKNLGGWKSSSVAESYIEQSETTKIGISKKILTGVQGHDVQVQVAESCSKRLQGDSICPSVVNIRNIEHCIINVQNN